MIADRATAVPAAVPAMDALLTILRARPAASAMAPPRPSPVRTGSGPDLTAWDAVVGLLATAGPGVFAGGVPTGLSGLDALTGGLGPGRLVVVRGPDPAGTTAFVLGLLRTCAVRHGLPALLFSPAAPRASVGRAIAAAETGVEAAAIGPGRASAAGLETLAALLPSLTAAPLTVDDHPSPTLGRLRRQAAALVRRDGVRLVVVDDLHMVGGVPPEDLPRELKVLARELDVPLVVVSGPAPGRGRRAPGPCAASASLADHADLVLRLDHGAAGPARLRVAKNRTGPAATLALTWQPECGRFTEPAPEPGCRPGPA